MDNNKEQLLQEIRVLLANMTKRASLAATISQLESSNSSLQNELENVPMEQTKYVKIAEEEVREKSKLHDRVLGKRMNKVFMLLLIIFAVINAVLLFVMVNKEGVAGKMQEMNMNFAGNYTMDEIIGVLFPFTLILALLFQVAAIIGWVYISQNIDIGDR